MDPTRRRSGGALLGDRIRMNALAHAAIFMRSLATRRQHLATSAVLADTVQLLKSAGFDLVVVETAGIGQSDTEIVDLVDLSMYVMTADYGAASQLEKIDMLDFADLIVLNKFDKRGAEDALRDVRKQWRATASSSRRRPRRAGLSRPSPASSTTPASMRSSARCARSSHEQWGRLRPWKPEGLAPVGAPKRQAIIPGPARALPRGDRGGRAQRAPRRDAGGGSRRPRPWPLPSAGRARRRAAAGAARALRRGRLGAGGRVDRRLRQAYNEALDEVGTEGVALLKAWPARREAASPTSYSYRVRDREVRGSNYRDSLSHQQIPKIAAPSFEDWGELLTFLLKENLPGAYPYTGGVYPYRRADEDPTRMFAGEGTPERTNRRFHYLARGQPATRLSTAFDSTTLYGEDPASGRTSTARSATPASRSPRSTT